MLYLFTQGISASYSWAFLVLTASFAKKTRIPKWFVGTAIQGMFKRNMFLCIHLHLLGSTVGKYKLQRKHVPTLFSCMMSGGPKSFSVHPVENSKKPKAW